MTHTCPTCGSSTEGREGVSVDLETNTALIDGAAIRLPAKEAELLWLFVDSTPKTVTLEYAMSRLYFQGADEPGDNIIRVRASNIRTRLRAAGVKDCIKTGFGKGWRIG